MTIANIAYYTSV